MNTGNAIYGWCGLTAAALLVCLLGEHRASSRLARENVALRNRIRDLSKAAPGEQLSAPATVPAKNNAPAGDLPLGSSTLPNPRAELARLQKEAETLRAQTNELELLRAESARSHMEETAGNPASGANGGNANGPSGGLEILEASYGTEHTNFNVADELRERIRGGSLKAIASNNLKGDPEFGQVKHLNLVYRLNGSTFTNDFREGDFVVIPQEPP